VKSFFALILNLPVNGQRKGFRLGACRFCSVWDQKSSYSLSCTLHRFACCRCDVCLSDPLVPLPGGLSYDDVQAEFTELFFRASALPSPSVPNSSSASSASATSTTSSSSSQAVAVSRPRSISGGTSAALVSSPLSVQSSVVPPSLGSDQDAEKARIQAQIGLGKSAASMNEEGLKEYVEQLYLHFTGRKGDPASANFLFQSLLSKTYTLTQAELFVKFSKEGKTYREQQAQVAEKRAKDVREYVKELYRVYLKQASPEESELSQHVSDVSSGVTSLQTLEDHFKLLSLSPPSN